MTESAVVDSRGLLPQLVDRIVDVLRPVQVWLFGSRARGEARADSDWDFLAILLDRELGLRPLLADCA